MLLALAFLAPPYLMYLLRLATSTMRRICFIGFGSVGLIHVCAPLQYLQGQELGRVVLQPPNSSPQMQPLLPLALSALQEPQLTLNGMPQWVIGNGFV